ncbi:hypothetical protein N7530_005502 [Penicillium desertorum]|uniref:Uncharacterized protein n=1 Tax=Penicillium desertorum TaxID=1303715 RepID=A0A9X0BRK5_9EURO|nr:hypothetical protein N7530_005502 [Penicillium desertorum]
MASKLLLSIASARPAGSKINLIYVVFLFFRYLHFVLQRPERFNSVRILLPKNSFSARKHRLRQVFRSIQLVLRLVYDTEIEDGGDCLWVVFAKGLM